MESLRQFFDELSREWDEQQPEGRLNTLHRLIARFDKLLCKDTGILEVGCGTGALIPVLRQRYLNASLCAVDLSLPMLRKAVSLKQEACLCQADVHALPFEAQSFSSVICHDSFPHFQEKPKALKEMGRVLQEDGRLFILHDISRARVNAVHRRARADVIHGDVLPDGSTLGRMLRDAGFEPVFLRDDDECFVAVGIRPG
jgi:ubiquinone/menaquinone biosynthesis C-methylase UbiE